MKEDFLHFVWRTGRFAFTRIVTTTGQPVEVLDFGTHNLGSGPDFENARLRINGVVWAGSVEMHLTSSDWHRHGHSDDAAYENVILHVVLDDDKPVYANGTRIPCVEIGPYVETGLLSKYLRLMSVEQWVPCAPQLKDIPEHVISMWVQRMTVERLQERSEAIRDALNRFNGDWNRVAYVAVARSFGFHVNGAAFERLARIVGPRQVNAVSDDITEVEALLFGSAGMLNAIFIDAYPVMLGERFVHLQRKYEISPMDDRAWKWGRLRPGNFPTVRIAQFAALASRTDSFLSVFESCMTADELIRWLSVEASPYWTDHTKFDRESKAKPKRLGKHSAELIIINAIAPVLFTYGKYTGREGLCEQSLRWMEEVAPESNRIVRKWEELGFCARSAAHTQGLIHLKHSYCDAKKCSNCAIGAHILLTEEK